jgi:hypothetical protein
MVQELSSLSYSNIFSNRPSFISTHITESDNNELRRYSLPHADPASPTCPATGRRTSRTSSTSWWCSKQ